MDEPYQEVRYDLYCKKCRYEHTDECDDPCDECLEHSVRFESNIPERFEKK